MGKSIPRKSPDGPMTVSSVSGRGRPQRWSHGGKRTVPVPRANPAPPGLHGIHRLTNRVLVASLLISTALCVLELQVRLNMSRTYTALQEARTMQQLYLDSRSQLVAALGTVDGDGTTEQGDGLAGQDPEPLVLPPPPRRLLKRRPLLASPGRWLNDGIVLRGY